MDCENIDLGLAKRLIFKKCLKGLMKCPNAVEYIEFDAGSIFLINEIHGDNIEQIKIKRKIKIKQKSKNKKK